MKTRTSRFLGVTAAVAALTASLPLAVSAPVMVKRSVSVSSAWVLKVTSWKLRLLDANAEQEATTLTSVARNLCLRFTARY